MSVWCRRYPSSCMMKHHPSCIRSWQRSDRRDRSRAKLLMKACNAVLCIASMKVVHNRHLLNHNIALNRYSYWFDYILANLRYIAYLCTALHHMTDTLIRRLEILLLFKTTEIW